ncbi:MULTISPECIES: hypothetical protein [unclassified Rhodococcus (in: high G+C Gram-positive bacteria)]|jgi:hypothetical protein|uniref:hypothetical protein n=1 Tax=unclassified Rhodococcus (in: high G+C Gram-positive bacteria) TaxID=192944 RepID=UPI000ACA3C80|nr:MULTISPECIES: hypothetical protein [unclassified Rhodococcus (in: high G+C Gram-positive bacteria)]
MSLLHAPKTSTAPVTEGHYPSVPTTPLTTPSRPTDDAYPGILRTLAMFLFAR